MTQHLSEIERFDDSFYHSFQILISGMEFEKRNKLRKVFQNYFLRRLDFDLVIGYNVLERGS